MHDFFAERRLVFNERAPKDREDREGAVENLANRRNDVTETQDILQRSAVFRRRLAEGGVLNKKEQKKWEDKLENLMHSESLSPNELAALERQLEGQQNRIRNRVDNYTQRVMGNVKEAFTEDSAKEYIEWFKELPEEDITAEWDQARAERKLTDEIRERVELRKEIVKLRPDLAKEVTKWRRHEMRDRLEELRECDKRINLYESWLDRDAKHFSKESIGKFKKQLRDLTPEKLDEWIAVYKEETLKPREALTEKFKTLPKEFQDSSFKELRRRDKVKFFENLNRQLERDFDREVEAVKSTTWSKESKDATKKFFKQAPLQLKAKLLKKLESGEMLKEDEKLTNEYKGFSDDVLDLEPHTVRKWENCSIDKKKEMIKQMKREEKLMKRAVKLLDYYEKNRVIGPQTRADMFEYYKHGTDFKGRTREIGGFASMILPRKNLLDDFENLDPKAQTKFSKFYKEGYRERLKLFNAANDYNDELIAEKTEKKDTAKVEKKQGKESADEERSERMITSLQSKAKIYEEIGKLQEALAMHETVLEGDPQNALSKKKQEELTMLLEAQGTTEDPDILEALENIAKSESMKAELEKIAIVREVFADSERKAHKHAGQEDVTKQTTHLSADEKALHEELVKQSGGKLGINEKKQVKENQKFDVLKFGNEVGQVHNAKRALQELGHDDHLPAQFVDESRGTRSDHNKVRDDIDKREALAKRELEKRSKGILKPKKGISEKKREEEIAQAAKKVVGKGVKKRRIRA
ncbi:hypothetical protein ACFL3C_02095 [Patescibacteria group bacterium]